MEISAYKSIMYVEAADGADLRTGDVVRLQLDDFRSFVKYEPILTLLKQFEEDPQFPQHFWAILNQPCNMIHDESAGRVFQHNLFLCPLMGFKTALKKGAFGDLVLFEEVKRPEKEFLDCYMSYFVRKAKTETPKEAGEENKAYSVRLENTIVRPLRERLQKELDTVTGQFQNPDQVLSALKVFFESDGSLVSSFSEFGASQDWKKAIDKYRTNLEAAEQKNKNIILKSGAAGRLAQLALNQLDSQGVFFYEPNPNISAKEHDLAHVIFLQDMLTVKISQEVQQSGALVSTLKDRRVLSLSENFSDRLLNIMGNYFSKIGTDDVKIDKITELYASTYPDNFFPDEEAFSTHTSSS